MTEPPMLQHPGEFAQLLALYRQRRPGRVLEIGTHLGGTLYHWLRDATEDATVVAVDISPLGSYQNWVRADVTFVFVLGDSNSPQTVETVARFAPFDWIFIDADHHEQQVRNDWRLYRELAAPGAVVAFHDTAVTDDPTVEVDRLWADLKAEHETVEFVADGGFGIGVVHMPRRLAAVPVAR